MALAASPPQRQASRKPARMRRHGCQTPWALAQIVAIGVVLLSTAVFYIFSARELPSDLRRTILVLVSAQVAMVTVLYVAISLLDPAHPAVIERQTKPREPSAISATQSPDSSIDLERGHHPPLKGVAVAGARGTDPAQVASPALSSSSSSSGKSSGSARSTLQCALCDAGVSHGTRHCSVCRKCVVGFDHHCVYINTCIGSRNYPLFIALLSCSILLVASQLTIAGFAIDRLCRKGDTSRAVVMSALCVLPMLQLICMIILASFHTYLFCKGLRTYEWLQGFHQQMAQRYTAKTPKWKHQSHRRTGRDSLDYGEDDSTLASEQTDLADIAIEVTPHA